jgi:hypothetical protein
VAPIGTKGPVEFLVELLKKNEIFSDFFNFHIFGYLNCLIVSTLISNYPYSHVKVHIYDQTSK